MQLETHTPALHPDPDPEGSSKGSPNGKPAAKAAGGDGGGDGGGEARAQEQPEPTARVRRGCWGERVNGDGEVVLAVVLRQRAFIVRALSACPIGEGGC
jgi:hypothetical protein